MSLQSRIITVVFLILALTFGTFAYLVFDLPNNVRGTLDEDLEMTARQMVIEASSGTSIELEEVNWPNSFSPMSAAGAFYIVLDAEEQVVQQSDNLPLNRPISPQLTTIADITDEQIGDQTLRVINYPVVGEFDDGDRLIGYLQVARPINDFAYLQRLTYVLLLAGGASLSFAMFLLGLMVPISLRQLSSIAEAAQRINSAEDLTRRIPVTGGGGDVGQLTEAFNNLLERLETLFKTQQRLLADVSHELRTPLTAIRGNIDLIRRVGPDPESLDAIETEMERMTRLVTDLLSLARAEVGGLPIREEVVDLDNIFLSTYEQFSSTTSPARVLLTSVDQARVIGDPDRLKQLLINLISNAIKYSKEGGTVNVSLTTAAENAYVTVADDGIGIPSEDLPHIFERFYRVNKARTRVRGGAGLGLAITQSIAQAHNGEITVESEVEVGSTFTFRIPLLTVPEVAEFA